MKKRNSRSGFTLVEMMIGLLVVGLLIIGAYGVLISQKKASDAENSYIDAQQNGRVALETMQKDLRLAGLNIDDFNGQPVFIDAAPYQVIFNADISSGINGVQGMSTSESVPLSDGTSYTPGMLPGESIGALSRYNNNAETIRYTLDHDDNGIVDATDVYTITQNPDDYAIYREENGYKKDMIASGIRGRNNYPDGTFPEPVFKYYGDYSGTGVITLWGDNNGDGRLSQAEIASVTPVSQNMLSRIIEVQVTIEAESATMQAGYSGRHSAPSAPRNYRSVTMTSKIRPRNVGTGSANLHACGNPPGAPSSLTAVDTPKDAGESITLGFDASFDESGGEEDLTSYNVYRRIEGMSEWECIGMSVPKGISSYVYVDDASSPAGGPQIGTSYYYYVTAWDCRPQESVMSNIAGPVQAVPNGPDPPVITDAFDTPCDNVDEVTVVVKRSIDDLGGASTLVDRYEVYRSNEGGGGILSKTLVGIINADGSEYYNFLDSQAGNLAGQPPEANNYYYYVARALSGAPDTIPSVNSNEYGGVFYSGAGDVSACQLTNVFDYPDDEGESLVLTWAESPSEACVPAVVSGYIVERKSIFEPAWTPVFACLPDEGTSFSHIDVDLTRGAEYTYRVITRSFEGSEVPSNEMTGVPLRNTELDPPENLAANDILCDATGSVNVTFENAPQDIAPAGSVDYYRIYRKVEFGGYFQIAEVEATGSDTYLFVDGPSTNPSDPPVIGEFYYYQATAYDSDNSRESSPSNEGYTMSDGEPGAPRITSAYDTPVDAGGSITVVFDRSADDGHCTDNVIVYRIYREESAIGAFDHIVGEITAVGSVSYTFTDDELFGLDPPLDGVAYYYSVRAVETSGEESVNSNVFGPVFSICQEASSYIVFEDDFEGDKGWTHNMLRTQDDWQRGTPAGKGGENNGNDDPASAHSGNYCYGNDLGEDGWNGQYKNNTDNELITPSGAIDCSSSSNVVLQFYRWLNIEAPAYDQASIYISIAGTAGPWTRIWRNPTEITDDEWTFVELDIAEWADGEADVAIRFRLKTDGGSAYSGWNIDDVVVRENAATP
ncbi:MAG: choice-of-anchor J domain-containing protein [Candidatus Krumholzibacteriota bacterium]|nr:choice-of-anchor J domain-containing protein [Candidatus Krumholzibacteriota bacterium]